MSIHIQSLWTDTAELPSFPALKGDARTDVLIIGGGLTGILCAHALAQDGVNCLLIEQDRILRGTTAGTTAKITLLQRPIYDRLIRSVGLEGAMMYRRANENARKRYDALCRSMDCAYEAHDAYVYATGSTANLEKEWNAMNRAGLHVDFMHDLPLPFPVAGALRLKGQAQFHPLKFAAAIAKELNIRESTKAQAWDGKCVVTNRGTITAKKIIAATHFPLFNKHGAYFLKLYQHRSYVLALRGAMNVNGMYVDEAENGLSLRNSGDLLLLGGGAHTTGKTGGGWAALGAFRQSHAPDAETVYRWAAQDCMSLDGLPLIGRYAKHTPDLFVATGYSKWGMTSAMIAAEILCELAQGRQHACAQLFAPDRSMMKPQLLVNGFETAKSYLTPTAPRCPHLGCALKWNKEEHSWDCPCHGSRFGEKGELLHGPATDDLPHPPQDKQA